MFKNYLIIISVVDRDVQGLPRYYLCSGSTCTGAASLLFV